MINVRRKLAISILAGTMALGGCGGGTDTSPVKISTIGQPADILAPLDRLETAAAKVSFSATAQGLVGYNAAGEVVPGLAQRWIVIDDGKTYIFRLRRAQWADGRRVDAKDVKRLIEARLRAAARTDPYGAFASVSNIVAMTGDVLEIDLSTPRPNFLMALAEPAMGIAKKGGGTGPYRASIPEGARGPITLTPVDHASDAEETAPQRDLRILRAERAARAVVRFDQKMVDLVLGGTLADLPYVTLADIDAKAVRFDPVQGLFGLALSPRNPMFDDAGVRGALSMAIEREAMVAYFAINRWKIADHILPQQLNLPHAPTTVEWTRTPIADRRNLAAATIARWQAQHGGKPVELTIELPRGPGMDLLLIFLQGQYRKIGVALRRVDKGGDLTLVDEVAPYDSVSWYLGRLSCAHGVHCDPDAEDLLKSSISSATMADRLQLYGQIEPLVQAHGGFIPLAMPVRWSLVAPRLDGFQPSSRGFHPLRWLLQ